MKKLVSEAFLPSGKMVLGLTFQEFSKTTKPSNNERAGFLGGGTGLNSGTVGKVCPGSLVSPMGVGIISPGAPRFPK